MKTIDITQELFSCQVYPGDPSPHLDHVRQMPQDEYNLTNISLCVHNGTHIDAPRHFIADGKTVDELSLDIFFGKCTVAEFNGIIEKNDIVPVIETCSERLLLKGHCEISEEAASIIVNSHVKLIGVEGQSVGNVNTPLKVHLILLNKSVIPLEGVNLSRVEPGEYVLSAFPLKLGACEGSPVRAVLIKED